MKKIKKFLCKENPGVLSMYIIVALIVLTEFYMMGWWFIAVALGAVVCGGIIFGIGYGLMHVIKRLQLNCAEEDV
jgi:hypothetical protein